MYSLELSLSHFPLVALTWTLMQQSTPRARFTAIRGCFDPRRRATPAELRSAGIRRCQAQVHDLMSYPAGEHSNISALSRTDASANVWVRPLAIRIISVGTPL